jgi:hypothetical protein
MSHGLSSREREMKAILDSVVEGTPNSNVRPARNRDRQRNAEEVAADAASPAQAAFNQRAKTIDMYANAHIERQAQEAREAENRRRKRANAEAEAERVRLAHQAEDERIHEAKEAANAQLLANVTRAEITSLIRSYDLMDRLPDLQKLVAQQGLGMQSVIAWETACGLLAKKV